MANAKQMVELFGADIQTIFTKLKEISANLGISEAKANELIAAALLTQFGDLTQLKKDTSATDFNGIMTYLVTELNTLKDPVNPPITKAEMDKAISAAVTKLVGDAPEAMDTLGELVTALTAKGDAAELLKQQGTLANLTTTAKTNLVEAINEVKAALGTVETSVSTLAKKNETIEGDLTTAKTDIAALKKADETINESITSVKDSITKLNGLQENAGSGTNIVLGSKTALRFASSGTPGDSGEGNVKTLKISTTLPALSLVRSIALSADVEINATGDYTRHGTSLWRCGLEVPLTFTDETTETPSYWVVVDEGGATFKGPDTKAFEKGKRRVSLVYAIPEGKTLKSIGECKLGVQNITVGGEGFIEISNPKIEFGKVATNWSAAPEDFAGVPETVTKDITANKESIATLTAAFDPAVDYAELYKKARGEELVLTKAATTETKPATGEVVAATTETAVTPAATPAATPVATPTAEVTS